MSEIITSRSLWREAGLAGLVLGGVAVVLPLISGLIPSGSGSMLLNLLLSVLKFALWLAKFVGCIWLVKYFMIKLVKKYDEVDNSSTFNFGMASSFLSALIVSAVSLFQSTRIDSAEYLEQMQTAMSSYSGALDSNMMAVMERMVDKLPTITFFSTLIYCFVFGLIVPYIWSRNIPAKDPFTK